MCSMYASWRTCSTKTIDVGCNNVLHMYEKICSLYSQIALAFKVFFSKKKKKKTEDNILLSRTKKAYYLRLYSITSFLLLLVECLQLGKEVREKV